MAIINKGEVLFTGSPQQALAKIGGKIWRTILPKQAAVAIAQDYRVISTKFNTGQVEVHILSDEKPRDSTLQATDPQLEDVYFAVINRMI